MDQISFEIVGAGVALIVLFVWGMYKCFRSDND